MVMENLANRLTQNADGFIYFSKELDSRLFLCSHTGKEGIDTAFVHRLDQLRHRCGFPFKVSSGFRDVTHPSEARKSTGGTHTLGIAADIQVFGGAQRLKIVREALALDFTGVGVGKDFVHVDTRATTPVLWTY